MRNLFLLLFCALLDLLNGDAVTAPLASFYPTKQARGRQIVPVHDSQIYPNFIQIESSSTSRSFVQISKREIQQVLDDLQNEGYLATSICSYRYLNESFYVVNADFIRGIHEVFLDMDIDELQEKTTEQTNKRIKPNHICVSPNGKRFNAVFHKTDEYLWHFIIQSGSLESIFESDIANGQEGYYPDVLQVFRHNNTVTGLAIWRKGYGVRYRVHQGAKIEQMQKELRNSPSMSLYAVSALSAPRGTLYGIWKDNGFSWLNKPLPRIARDSNVLQFADWEVEQKLREENIPAISINIRRNGVNKHSVAYGFADIRMDIPVNPNFRFRIASISKTITAMGIQHLLNERRIFLNQPVMGPGGILGNAYGSRPYNRFMLSMTLQHLLEHTSGAWDHTEKFEFDRQELGNRTSFLNWLFDKHPSGRIPGFSYTYSNIGYVILGRIIEHVHGQTYEDFMRNNLLTKLGINGSIGRKERLFDEVTYYSRDNANPYFNWDPERLDAAAGWVFTAEEVSLLFEYLAKHRYDIYRTITSPSQRRYEYGRGVQLGLDGSLYHVGSLAGTEGIGFTRNGIQCSILANVRGKKSNYMTGWMLQLCRDIASRLEWGLDL